MQSPCALGHSPSGAAQAGILACVGATGCVERPPGLAQDRGGDRVRDAPAGLTRTAPVRPVRRGRSWRRMRGLGPAYYHVAVRWASWALALIITLAGAAPATNLAPAG